MRSPDSQHPGSARGPRAAGPLGITPEALIWRRNSFRPQTLHGVERREIGSGISADVDAMARTARHGPTWRLPEHPDRTRGCRGRSPSSLYADRLRHVEPAEVAR
jgi:hypothetical protein